MDSNYRIYDHIASFARLDAILATPAGNYEEVDNLPDRDRLTFTNGFYANCTALFIDIRNSSSLPSAYNRPVLAKIYRAFISEIVAIFNGSIKAREINIVGDCVWAVYKTPYTSDLDDIFSLAAEANSLTKVLNYKMQRAGYNGQLSFGIGISWGRALMIKAGLAGSVIHDVVYMGDVVNKAAKLASVGSNGFGVPPVIIDEVFYNNINEENRSLMHRLYNSQHYGGNIVNVAMEDWYVANCR